MADQEVSKKRRATEARIIDAFDRMVRRDGLRSVGVNRLIEEAGVSKGLLYTYFGGLPGLVKVWGEQYEIWPSMDQVTTLSDDELTHLDPTERITALVTQHAENLREGTLRTELLADELMAPTAISEVLSQIRRQLGEEHRAIFAKSKALQDKHVQAVLTVLLSAATYISMRAAKSPHFMGVDLSTEDGWNEFIARMVHVIELAMIGAQAKQSSESDEKDTETDAPADSN